MDFGYLRHVAHANRKLSHTLRQLSRNAHRGRGYYPCLDMFVHGPVSQSFFLQTLGIRERLMQVLHSQAGLSQKDSDSLIQGVEKLIKPSDMGDKFKFMAITCPSIKSLTGFS